MESIGLKDEHQVVARLVYDNTYKSEEAKAKAFEVETGLCRATYFRTKVKLFPNLKRRQKQKRLRFCDKQTLIPSPHPSP